MKQTKIAFLCPLMGNGGIASWSRKFISTFPNEYYKVIPINIAPNKDFTLFKGIDRLYYGIKSFIQSRRDLNALISNNKDVTIMHLASGLGLGVIRDYFLAKSFKKTHGKCILHCHNGGIQESYEDKGILGLFFRQSLKLFHQIWVLDEHSASFLRSKAHLHDKVFLTPNSIVVPTSCNLSPKSYKKIGFVGNIIPSKGIYELTEAVSRLNNGTILYIIGEGSSQTISHVRSLARNVIGKTVFLLGRLSNEDAIKTMESLDIICLPTYYSAEAFPISILEAMSKGKIVISCSRAAIPDMLTSIDGSECGILVPPKNSEAISEAILWCQKNSREADKMCLKAYEKVTNFYDIDVVYNIYRDNYRKLVIGD